MQSTTPRLDNKTVKKLYKCAIKGRITKAHGILDPLIDNALKQKQDFFDRQGEQKQEMIDKAKASAFESAMLSMKNSRGSMDYLRDGLFQARFERTVGIGGTISSFAVAGFMLFNSKMQELFALLGYAAIIVPIVGAYTSIKAAAKSNEHYSEYRYDKESVLSHMGRLVSQFIEGAFTFDAEAKVKQEKREDGEPQKAHKYDSFNGRLTVEQARRILGVPAYATKKDIRSAFAAKALEVHPDKNGGTEQAKLEMQVLNCAYEKLTKGK